MDGDRSRGEDDGNPSTVVSGRVDALFDDVETTIESLAGQADELESVRRRLEATEASGAVRDRVNDDADQLADEAEAALAKLLEDLRTLKRIV